MITVARFGRVLPELAMVLALVLGQPAFAKNKHPGSGQHGGSHATQPYSAPHGSHAKGTHKPIFHVTGGKHGGSKAGTSHSGSTSKSTSHVAGNSHSGSKAVAGAKRDAHGKIARSTEAKDEFKKSHPCPSTGKSSGACPGFVIDHVTPLKRGGADKPSNMQWQSKEAAKAKDKTE
jgi:hypothetical protein